MRRIDPVGRPGNKTGRRYLLFALSVVLLISLCIGGYALWHRLTAPHPPVVPLAGIDPEIASAVREAQEDVRQSPYSGSDWGRLGMLLYAHAFYPQATVCLGEAERFEPDDPRWPYLRGFCFIQQDSDPESAIPDLRRAAALAGDTPDAPRLLLAETLMGLGRLNEAEPLLRRSVQHDPGDARALLGLGRLELSSNHIQEAQTELTKSYQNAPNVKATVILLAQTFQRLGDPKRAAALVKQAAALPDLRQEAWPDPFLDEAEQMRTGKAAQIQRGERLIVAGQFNDAAALMQQTTTDYPDSARAWTLLGAAETGKGDPADGEQALRRALAIDPNSAEIINHLGDALARQGRYAEAAIYFRKALASNPVSAEFHFNLGVCLLREHNTSAALKEFETTLSLDPATIKGRAGMAEALTQEHQIGAAIQQLQSALKLSPHDPILERSLAQLHYQPIAGTGKG